MCIITDTHTNWALRFISNMYPRKRNSYLHFNQWHIYDFGLVSHFQQ